VGENVQRTLKNQDPLSFFSVRLSVFGCPELGLEKTVFDFRPVLKGHAKKIRDPTNLSRGIHIKKANASAQSSYGSQSTI
jgi:hypothetical protein